jgi:hypothetical protein
MGEILGFLLFLTGINDIEKNVIAGVNDTPEKLFTGVNGDKLYSRQRSFLSARQSPAAKVGHSLQYCHWNRCEKAKRHLPHPDQRPLRPPKLLQTKNII